jgi:ribosomal protein L24E
MIPLAARNSILARSVQYVLKIYAARLSYSESHTRNSLGQWLTDYCNLQGKLYIRGDSKIFRFQNGKTESLFLQRKNPRRIAWTTLYRRMHKKGISEVSKP